MRWLGVWRAALAAIGLMSQFTTDASAVSRRPRAHPQVLYGVPIDASIAGRARTLMETAVAGARRRLATTQCQAVLSDFSDQKGRPLSKTLAEQGRTAVEELDAVYFTEANVTRQCLDGRRLAFTAPGSRVVFLCGQIFEPYTRQDAEGSEVVIIHEFLHVLGLGENPPSSREISERVRSRCRAIAN